MTRPLTIAAALLFTSLAAACAGAHPAAHAPSAQLVAQPIAPGREWLSTRQRSHPLAGRIWDVKRQVFADEGFLASAVAGSDFVLLGEVHDNPDAHLLQARLVRAASAAGKKPALAMEMLDADVQPEVDRALATDPRSADAFAKAVKWDESGWPDFVMYRPILVAALDAGLPVKAANLPKPLAKAAVKQGKDGLPEAIRARLSRDEPLPEPVVKELREEMRTSHCNVLPEPLLDPMALAQRARDAQMALTLEATGAAGAILVTGNGHARNDRGVPAILAKDAPGRRIVSVGILEVESGRPQPKDYVADWGTAGGLPFDYVIFTPGAERPDPCAKLREMHAPKKADAPKPASP
ncbi:MAG: ChaN family lipoprotein [Anaeromyxobacter sp.]